MDAPTGSPRRGSAPPPIRIRTATADDVDAIRRVEVAAGRRFAEVGLDAVADDPPPGRGELMAHVGAGTAWVAVDGGDVVGFSLASTVDGEAHLDQVSVVPGAGRRGVGRALVAAVAEWATAGGHDAVTLTTYRDVAFNGPWYRSLGFEDLRDDELGPELAAIRAAERARGLDLAPRAAMRKQLV